MASQNTTDRPFVNGHLILTVAQRLLAAALTFGFVACDAEPDAEPTAPEVA